jgi:two-component system, NtrC family, sensor kinase
MVLVKGTKSRIIWPNKAFRDYYGMSEAQLQETNLTILFSTLKLMLTYLKLNKL